MLELEAQKLRIKGLNRWKDIDKVLHYQELPFVFKIIWTDIISWYYDNLLVGYFNINKIEELTG